MNEFGCWLTGGHEWEDRSESIVEGGVPVLLSVTMEYEQCTRCGKVKW